MIERPMVKLRIVEKSILTTNEWMCLNRTAEKTQNAKYEIDISFPKVNLF